MWVLGGVNRWQPLPVAFSNILLQEELFMIVGIVKTSILRNYIWTIHVNKYVSKCIYIYYYYYFVEIRKYEYYCKIRKQVRQRLTAKHDLLREVCHKIYRW